MTKPFVVIRSRGQAWDHSKPIEQQVDWERHAALMDALAEEKFILVGGPLEGNGDAVLVVQATDPDEIVKRFAPIHGHRMGC